MVDLGEINGGDEVGLPHNDIVYFYEGGVGNDEQVFLSGQYLNDLILLLAENKFLLPREIPQFHLAVFIAHQNVLGNAVVVVT